MKQNGPTSTAGESLLFRSELEGKGDNHSIFDPFSRESVGKNRSTIQRVFGKIESSSMRGGIITLITGAIGLGLLTYPKAFSFYGYVLGSLAISYSAGSTIISYSLMAAVCAQFPRHSLYSELVLHFLGKRWATYSAWIFITYEMKLKPQTPGFLKNLLYRLLHWVHNRSLASFFDKDNTDDFKRSIKLYLTIGLATLFFFGTLMKRIGIVRYLGILIFVMVIYLVVVTVVQAHSYVEQTDPQYQPFGTVKLFELDRVSILERSSINTETLWIIISMLLFDYMLHFGLFLFAFNALPVFHQVYVQLELPTVRRIRKIGRRVSLLLLAFYALFTLAAYISLGSSMQASSFDIFPNKKPLPTDPHDIYMKILKIVFMVCLLSTYLANSIPLKTQLRAELGIKETTFSTIFLSLLIVSLTGFLSYVYPDISNWFSILGSIGATSMITVLPSMMYYRAFRDDPTYKHSLKLVALWAAACIVSYRPMHFV